MVLIGEFHEGGVGEGPFVEESFTGFVSYGELEPGFVEVAVSAENSREGIVATEPHLVAEFFGCLLALDTKEGSDGGEEEFEEFSDSEPDEEVGNAHRHRDKALRQNAKIVTTNTPVVLLPMRASAIQVVKEFR